MPVDVILCHNVLEYVEDRKVIPQGIHPSLETRWPPLYRQAQWGWPRPQTVVFENDPQKALDLLAGQDLETHSMGLAQAYDLDRAVEDLALEVQDYQGIRVFYALTGQSL